MAEALENAYLVLLGQIALVLSAIVFGVPFFFSTPGATHLYQPATVLFLAFTFSASLMMVVNIIIGWAALRGSMESKEHYTIKMFVVDVLIVLIFFLMNNAILFSFGGTLSFDKITNLRDLLSQGVPIRTVSFLAAALYFLTAVFLFLCKIWNRLYYRSSGKRHSIRYESFLWVIILAAIVSGVVALVRADSFITQVVLLPIWLLGWVYINGHWLVLDLFAPTKSVPPAPPVPPSPPASPLVVNQTGGQAQDERTPAPSAKGARKRKSPAAAK